MSRYKKIPAVMLLIALVFLFVGAGRPINVELYLTQGERDYIAGRGVIRAASIAGGAPLHYRDSKGEIRGIAVNVLKEIADMTGLAVEYELYDNVSLAFNSGADIFFGVTTQYAPEGMILSKPYLKSDTVLFMNSSLDYKRLSDKRYAALANGSIPVGVEEENTIYFNNREESMDAVEAGKADYGYGNAYSVAYYMLQNSYKNIVTIPKGIETREYCIGFPAEDEILLSIINKSIAAMDDRKMQNLILDMASHIERKVTFSMIMDSHGGKILALLSLIISTLTFSTIQYTRMNNRLKIENKRHELLSHISNECLFEYHIAQKNLVFSEKCEGLFGVGEKLQKVSKLLEEILLDDSWDKGPLMVRLPLVGGGEGVFKTIKSNVYDDGGKLHSIIGKLIDYSDEEAEREKLIAASQMDGLTGLYNAVTTRELISDRIRIKNKEETDAFIMMDCDGFKDINDRFGHLAGNEALKDIAKTLKQTFRETDIIGRVGGDEFCVYLKRIPSTNFIEDKCRQLNRAVKKINKDFNISISMGIAFAEEGKSYEDLFNEADNALYKTKEQGRAKFVIHGEK